MLPHPHWVKERQEPRHRRLKYRIARMLGMPRMVALRIKDWTDSHFIQYLEARLPEVAHGQVQAVSLRKEDSPAIKEEAGEGV